MEKIKNGIVLLIRASLHIFKEPVKAFADGEDIIKSILVDKSKLG